MDEKLFKTLLAPIVSEKSSVALSKNQYSFKVLTSASKKQIKSAIELLFKVNVLSVRTLCVKKKKKIFARKVGYRAGWKKAIVKLSEGQMIDLNAF